MNHCIKLPFNKILKLTELGFGTSKSPFIHANRILPYNVFLYIAKGDMHIYEDNVPYTLHAGEFIFLKSNVHHWGKCHSLPDTSWYWIHFYDIPCSAATKELSFYNTLSPKMDLFEENYNTYITLPKQGMIKQPKIFESRMNALIKTFTSTDPLRTLSLSLEVTKLFLWLFENTQDSPHLAKSDYTVRKILDYLHQKKAYPLSSKELEAHLGMNYSYLCEIFKTKTGVTLHQYNAQLFIHKSTSYMRNSSMNISEISDTLGFKTPFYFNRVFRKVMNCSPSEYLGNL